MVLRLPARSPSDRRHLRRRACARRLLEDLSRRAIDGQIRDLGGFARRLAAIDPARLTDIERLERPALDSNIRSRLFDLEQARPWERNPKFYSDIIATSLASQALFDYAPLSERARRVVSKLRQVPRLIQAARDNIRDAPGIYIKVGLESVRGTQRFIDDDLPRAFSNLTTFTFSVTWRMRRPKQVRRCAPLPITSRPTSRRRAKGRSDLGVTVSKKSCGSVKGFRSTPTLY